MEDMKPHEEGSLCIKQPWPSMARTIYGDHERFLTTYMKPFPGYYYTGVNINFNILYSTLYIYT